MKASASFNGASVDEGLGGAVLSFVFSSANVVLRIVGWFVSVDESIFSDVCVRVCT